MELVGFQSLQQEFRRPCTQQAVSDNVNQGFTKVAGKQRSRETLSRLRFGQDEVQQWKTIETLSCKPKQ